MSEVVYVAQVAAMLGMTEAALRAHVYRESRAIPKHFKMGTRLAWRRATVLKWLEERERRGS